MNPVLVLGALIDDDGRPSNILAARLKRAQPLIDAAGVGVVSGRGEAEAMAQWLIEHGVDAAKLLLETEATSTNENLENAQALLPDTRCWIVVTSDFHVLRTRIWAWHLGVPVQVIGARTEGRAWVKMFLRECLALPHSVLRVGWRRVRGILE
ncbi:YdcF family protein [Corynebacterium sp. A21]|uniref:YdcF family protein n=1 Tax=Corynebacterium sp. A21 TaxID=3457318 RepID=UPI003FD14ADF